jgi:hypothetical protein
MAIYQFLVMTPDRRPKMEDVVREAALDNSFVPERVDLATHSGFLPITVGARKTGFEYYFEPIQRGSVPDEALQFGSHAMVARTGGDFAENYASALFFKVAAKLSKAAYVNSEDGIVLRPDQVDSYLSNMIRLLKNYVN